MKMKKKQRFSPLTQSSYKPDACQIKGSRVSGSKRSYLRPYFNKLTKEPMYFHERVRKSCVLWDLSCPDGRNTLFPVEVGGESE